MPRQRDAEVINDDNAPLQNLVVSPYGPPRTLVFIAAPTRRYSLIRLSNARRPVYDLNALLEHDNPRHFVAAHLAQSRIVPSSVPIATVSQPLVLRIAFGVAIVLLGAVTLVTLKPRTSQ